MGYNLRIGELKSEQIDNTTIWDVEEVEIDHAPSDGSPTDHTNARWPSYSGWDDFGHEAGLSILFTELMPEHPGYAILKPRHKRMIDAVYANKSLLDPEMLGRLEWLKFWVDWALKNCKQPAFVNS